MLQVTGILKQKFAEQVVTDEFRKREFTLTIDAKSAYPQIVIFQLANDKCRLIESFQPGDELSVSFNIKGREWKSPSGEIKYFTSLDAWKIERTSAGESPMESPMPSMSDLPQEDYKDDLPF